MKMAVRDFATAFGNRRYCDSKGIAIEVREYFSEFKVGLVHKTIMKMAVRDFALALGKRRYCDS